MDLSSCASCGISKNVFNLSRTGNISSSCEECGAKPPNKESICQSNTKLTSTMSPEILQKSPRKVCTIQGKGKSPCTATVARTDSSDQNKRFACDTCGKRFKVRGQLIMHHVVHTGEKKYECHVCKKKFAYKSSLTDHVKVHSASTRQKFPCDGCQKIFLHKTYLVKHKRQFCSANEEKRETVKKGEETYYNHGVPLPSGEKGYLCLICGKQYVNRYNLRDHIRFHTRESVNKCEYCGKEFQKKSHLAIHTTIHTGDKKYLCSVCGKRFSQKSHLRAHMRSHTGEKKFACGECGKSFGIKAEVRRHMIKHTGDDRDKYLCEVCGKQLVDKYSFINHQNSHKKGRKRKKKGVKKMSRNERVKCDICKIFTERKLFAEHYKHHQKQDTLEPCSLFIVEPKTEILSDELTAIAEGKEWTPFNDSTGSTDCMKNDVQYDEGEEDSLLDTSFHVKKEEDQMN